MWAAGPAPHSTFRDDKPPVAGRIAGALNVGTDSLVFDDDAAECELIRRPAEVAMIVRRRCVGVHQFSKPGTGWISSSRRKISAAPPPTRRARQHYPATCGDPTAGFLASLPDMKASLGPPREGEIAHVWRSLKRKPISST